MTLKYEEVIRFMKVFGAECINYDNELIVDSEYNIYFHLNQCRTMADVEASTLLALCRPIGKGIRYENQKWKILLDRFNLYFNCELTRDDMREIYCELCYTGMLKATNLFITEGFQMDKLKKYAEMRVKG